MPGWDCKGKVEGSEGEGEQQAVDASSMLLSMAWKPDSRQRPYTGHVILDLAFFWTFVC